MQQPVKISLGGVDYEIKPLALRESRAWRQQLNGPLAEVTAALKGAGAIQITNGADIAALLETLSNRLVLAPDLIFELLLAYAPGLKADIEAIEATATDAEVMAAFTEVLRLAYPFGQLLAALRGNG